MTALAPVEPRERVAALDVLRALALAGVLVGNSYWLFSARTWEGPPDTTRLDIITHAAVGIFVESKAQTLLTFLFGFGFAAQLLRAQERDQPILGLYVRRLVVLGGIGALHVMLWCYDVTWNYAVAGFGLLLFRRASNRGRLVWAFILTFVPFMIGTLPPVMRTMARLMGSPDELDRARLAFLAALHGRHFWAVVAPHLRFAVLCQAPLYDWYYPWLVGHFLFGYVAGTQRWFVDGGVRQLKLFRRLLVWGLVGDVPNAALTIAARAGLFRGHRFGIPAQLIVSFLYQAGLLGLAAAYVAMVVLLMQRPTWRRLLLLLAPVGRLPLTTYIMQSVLCTFLYYGWGLGWAGKTHSAACVAWALAIFSLQVLASHLWLRHFRFGPLEWIWRALVYRRRPAMLARPAEAG